MMRVGYIRAMEKESQRPLPPQEITRGFISIAKYRELLSTAEKAPTHTAWGMDMEGNYYQIEENLAPWEAVDQAAQALAESQAAIRVLQAHQFTFEKLSPDGGVIIRNREGEVVRSREMPIFLKERNESPHSPHGS
jgi:hypothetical protein